VAEVRVDLPFKPYAHQRAAHALRLAVRFVVLVWHRRAGKTVFAIVELLLAALMLTLVAGRTAPGRYGFISPFLAQSKKNAWDYLKSFAYLIPGAQVHEAELRVELPNGAQIRLYGADHPESIRGGYFDGCVLDEVADMKPNVWALIIRPMLSDYRGWALFIGTPKGVNLFSELYYRALKETGAGEWAADLKRASETGVIPAAEIEQARREMSPAQFAQEFDCDFAAAVDDVLIRLDVVLAAQRRELHESEWSSSAKVLGVDVAHYGDDSSVLFPRQGLVAFQPKAVRGLDTMAVAGLVAQTIDTWKPDATFVDKGGIGAGVCDRLRQLRYSVVEVDFGFAPLDDRFENRRAEMWWQTGDWLKAGCIPSVLRLQQDLTAPRYTYKNRRGRLQLESKDDMRARGLPSPDWGDALACTFFAPVAPRGMPGNQQTRHEYNPLAKREA
jgi:hypothetical protein